MADKTDKDPLVRWAADINGSCKLAMIAGINGNLPKEWTCCTLEALPTFGDPPYVVCAGADRPSGDGWQQIGARIEVGAPRDLLQLTDELARLMCAKIRALGPPTLRIALERGAVMPTRGSAGASGYDLYAPEDVIIRSGQVAVIHSGVHVELPDDTWEVQIRPRSGMSKRGLWVAVGTGDSDYRGILGATVVNLTHEDQTVKRGERFAQMVICRVAHPEIVAIEVPDLTPTARGAAGFGSTGS